MKQPFGVILAGGLATRMGGGDKGLLPLGGRSIMSHVIDQISPQVAGVALNANGDAARFDQFGLPVLADSIDGFVGPLAGVLAGMDWAASQGGDHIVTVAADTPFFPPDLVPRLLLAGEGMAHPLVLACTPRVTNMAQQHGRGGRDGHDGRDGPTKPRGGTGVGAVREPASLKSGGSKRVNRHPTFGLWPVALREDLRTALTGGLRKVVLWTDHHNGREALFDLWPSGLDPFFNVNTPDDLRIAKGILTT
jgi:molybdopterin-guanine dinucleotide biosynthesis protein A